MADQSAEGLLSPFLRKQRERAAAPFLRGRVFDIGCGSGHLARLVEPDQYLGYDVDESTLAIARRNHPAHHFTNQLPEADQYDTVVALAVLEHIAHPRKALTSWGALVAHDGWLVLTTPHPIGVHALHLGARLGFFSREAEAEHHELFGRRAITTHAMASGLTLMQYHTFLLGFNQLVLLAPSRRPPS